MFGHQVDQPGVHELMQELRALIDEYDDRVLVGESDQIEFYGDGTNELHLALIFHSCVQIALQPAWILANQRERLVHSRPAPGPVTPSTIMTRPEFIPYLAMGRTMRPSPAWHLQ